MATKKPAVEHIEIQDEDQAVALLKKALADQLTNENIVLSFEDWPTIRFEYVGEKFDGTITPDIAKALVELQEALNHTYMRAVHGTERLSGMTQEEKSDVALVATVERGSSVLIVNISDLAEKIAFALVGKMTSEQIVITVLGVALIYGGVAGWKAYLKSRSEDKALEVASSERLGMSAQETERHRLTLEAQQHSPIVDAAMRLAEVPRNAFIKSAAEADSFTVQNSVQITGDEARRIYRAPRSSAREVQLNGTYIIEGFKWSADGENARVQLQRRDVSDLPGEFAADLSVNALTQEQRARFKDSTFDRAEVHLSINGTILHDSVTTAKIVAVAEQPARNAGR